VEVSHSLAERELDSCELVGPLEGKYDDVRAFSYSLVFVPPL
jgi:hypothetical protein